MTEGLGASTQRQARLDKTAHAAMQKIVGLGAGGTTEDIASGAWSLADRMEAERQKRIDNGEI